MADPTNWQVDLQRERLFVLFTELICKHIEEKKLSRHCLSSGSGIPVDEITSILRGEKEINLDLMARLSLGVGIEIDFVCKELARGRV